MVTNGRKTFKVVQSDGENPLITTLINRMTLVTMVTKRTKSRQARLIFRTLLVSSIPARNRQLIGMATSNMKAIVKFRFKEAPMPPDIVKHEYTFRKQVKTTPLMKTEWKNKSTVRLTPSSSSTNTGMTHLDHILNEN